MKLSVGDHAPDFKTKASYELGGRSEWALSEQLKKGPVLMVFYPRDFERFSTRRLCGYRDQWESLRKSPAQIVGISRSDEDMHGTFLAAYDLPFALLADPSSEISRLYGMTSFGFPCAGLALVDRARKIKFISRSILPFSGASAEELSSVLQHHHA
jgi:thioredoxin-dependent peroxiredoxin